MMQPVAICPKCNFWLAEPADECPMCHTTMVDVIWRTCPRCGLPTDDHLPRCQNCSALFDTLYEDEVVPQAERLFLESYKVVGAVTPDIMESPWEDPGDVIQMVIWSTISEEWNAESLEAFHTRAMMRVHYWRWIARRGGTAVPVDENEFEPVAERVDIFRQIAKTTDFYLQDLVTRN